MPCTKQQLTKPQLEAIDGTGPQLILAGPGSGKTCVVTQKIAHLLQSDVKPENLLALTFSEKAAAEMADKLAEMADRGELKIDVSDLTIGTFHSFCLELLRDNVLDSGISVTSILNETNQLDWARRHLDSFAFEHIEIGNNEINVIESIFQGISALRDELITPDKLQEYLKKKEGTQLEEEEEAYLGKLMDVLKVYRAYVAYKQQERLIDFDDMITEASQLLERKPDLLRRYRARYQHIIVDEFQDTNYPQFRLITQLASENICVFGDDDQSIYRFRGAYLTSFKDFKAQFSECHKTLLDANFRNSGNIFACAQQLMRSAPHRIDKTLTTVNADGDKLVIACCENEQAEVQFVCDAIERLVRDPERPRAYHDIALLSRRRIDAAKFQAALRERNIPCESVGEVDFFAEPIIRDALAYLRVIQNPMRAGISLNRIMRRCGITEANAQRLNARAELHARADDASDGVYDCMCDGNTALLTQAEELRELTDAIARMLALKDRTRVSELVYKVTVRRTDLYRRSVRHRNKRDVQLLNELNKLAQQYESTTPEPELSGFLDYLGLPGFQIELGESEDTDSVKALTVHQSKGMEFPVVFLVDAATNRFPSRFK
jgi:DNA helicase-2/ATP-dependent DNA helicase PcrA